MHKPDDRRASGLENPRFYPCAVTSFLHEEEMRWSKVSDVFETGVRRYARNPNFRPLEAQMTTKIEKQPMGTDTETEKSKNLQHTGHAAHSEFSSAKNMRHNQSNLTYPWASKMDMNMRSQRHPTWRNTKEVFGDTKRTQARNAGHPKAYSGKEVTRTSQSWSCPGHRPRPHVVLCVFPT